MKKKKDGFLLHEVLHMSCFLMNSVAGELVEHKAVKGDKEYTKLAEAAFKNLFDLYQAIGRDHL